MDGSTVQRSLTLSRARQCGMYTAKVGLQEVQVVATMDRPANYAHVDLGEASPYNAATLNLHGLPYDYASISSILRPSPTMPDLQCCPHGPSSARADARPHVYLAVAFGEMRGRWEMPSST